ncbi:non-ribosomal peptide synthetase [Gloeobacter morelensis]|uniref:Amino acid adenylation domain-containing protein n=1 Tax=Gloeobacter morelensis MG652769 TaxID=2781736 RepID=A0ABY3PRJ1_9CYAN|nr:non-ribosomal peptide synthetase [Gloeobacter morelensis]UFP96149.1 amino acid adenylation domain-containing protein [Gloeobacter morelensis MG652769]
MSNSSTSGTGPSPEQLKLFAQMLKQKGVSAPQVQTIPKREQHSPCPLSSAQQRLWFLDRLEPGDPAYNVPFALRLKGTLDLDALGRCFTEVVRRHESLRTTFTLQGGQPVQRIAPPTNDDAPLRVVDLCALAEPQREAHLQQLLAAEACRPFDLEHGPLLRTVVIRLGEDEHALLLTLHHIAADGWSVGVLTRELAVLYPAFQSAQPSPLPPLSVQYADFSEWQHRFLQDGAFEEQLHYWQNQLAGVPPLLELPLDRPRPQAPSSAGGWVPIELGPETATAIALLARREGATPFMVLLAALQTLLYRCGGQTDFLIGTPVANRHRGELEPLIGFFVNTLPLRADLSGDPSFRQLIARARESALGAYAHQDLPFEKLVEHLAPQQRWGRSPLVQAVFALQNAPASALELPGLSIESLSAKGRTAKFDLTLSLEEGPSGLCGGFEYSTDIFDVETVESLAERFGVLLAGIVARPETRLSRLPLLSESERRQVLVEWNPAVPTAETACVHELFERHAELTPEAPALEWADTQRLSYGELNTRANRLAHRLQALGVGPGSLVGLFAERSAEAVIGMLAILKAGGAYVPLDPAYPAERLTYLLTDAQVPVLLAQEHLAPILPTSNARVLFFADADVQGPEDGENLSAEVSSAALACVMYTSGSTGNPKGVLVPHQAINRLVREPGYLHFHSEQVFLQFAPLCFDAATFEIWGPLLNGARLAIAPAGPLGSSELAALITTHAVDTLWLSAGLFRVMVDEQLPVLRSLSHLLAGGDAVSLAHAERLLSSAGRCQLINGYGPTENTTFSCCHPLELGRGTPIGRPIGGTEAYILDSNGQPVPVGVAGELYLGGIGLARGYLNRAGLTAEKFVPHPYSERPGARLYRSGDLARFRVDGVIEYLGRTDDQVKIRGHRVEPGEVESVLSGHAGVRSCAVIARTDGKQGEKYLVAYVVSRGEAFLESELRAWLHNRLPSYMLPSAYVFLAELPLNINGKLDRHALPAPDAARPEAGTDFVAPRTAAEQVMAGIWLEVLGTERVGIHDNFFELGGHSLRATQAVSRLRDALGLEVPLKLFFERPTIAGLCNAVAAETAAIGVGVDPIPVAPRPDGVARFAQSFAQQRLWFLDRLEPGDPAYNVPFALRLKGTLDLDALGRCFTEVVRRHESLRTTFTLQGGQPVQRIAPPTNDDAPLRVVDLCALAEPQREAHLQQLLAAEACRPFDLEHGPLLRTVVIRLGEDEHALLLTLHHIAADGWSVGVLTRELAVLYPAFQSAQPSPLPPLSVQYADFSEWQHRFLQDGAFEEQLHYWQNQLAGVPPLLELPLDRPRPQAPSSAGGWVPIELGPETATAIALLARREGATPFMVLLAALQTLLYRCGGQTDFLIGTPVANRHRGELEPLIGFFVNTLPLRADLSGDPSFRQLIARARESALGAYAHQDLPFEKLVEHLAPQQRWGRSPLVQAVFALQNAPASALELPGLSIESLSAKGRTAKFDLTLSLEEGPSGLCGGFEYSTDIFDVETVESLAERFGVLLAGIVARPETRLSRLPLLSESERRQVLVEWNPAVPTAETACVHELFERHAELTPEAPALEWADTQRLSYGELNTRANRLAHRLQALGVGPGSLVGLFAERSAEAVIGMLAILKAGGAYVPLDPAYPAERLTYLLTDAQVPVLLAQEHLAPILPTSNARVLCLNTAGRLTKVEGDDLLYIPGAESNLPGLSAPADLAYVIYTSGSTGNPKGVQVERRNLANLIRWHLKTFSFAPGDRAAQIAAPAFDACAWEVWTCLCAGASLHFPDTHTRLCPTDLRDWLLDRQITHCFLPTPLAERVLTLPWPEKAPLRWLFVGGDTLHSSPPPGLPFALSNNYGPTENTVVSTSGVVPPIADGPLPSIGRPIGGTEAYILDSNGRPVPVGVAGELCLGGAGLARGYLGRAALTAEKFVPHPYSERPGARLYRSGDLARFRVDGRIEFLGRTDDQVKIRGHRVEPGEVASALSGHAGVRSCAVIACADDEQADKRLVAYVVQEGDKTGTAELRGWLQDRLPPYMLPSLYVFLAELPLNINGKLDRRALPVPGAKRPDTEAGFVAPRTDAERAVARVWSEVLGIERVGIHDNFFELGGHSLRATQAVSRLRDALGLEVPLKLFFERPTIAGLCNAVAAETAAIGVGVDPIPVAPRPDGVARFAQSFAQQRLWFLDRLEPGDPAYNVPFALRLKGTLDLDALGRCFTEVVRRHESLRTTFTLQGGQPVQRIAPPTNDDAPLRVVDLCALAEPQREAHLQQLLAAEACRPFDLEHGPLLRTVVIRLGEDEHALLLTLHHIAADGWSVGVLTRELAVLYPAFQSAQPSPLPPLSVQYADFSEWQHRFLQDGAFEEQLHYWQNQLAGVPPLLELPLDRPRPQAPSSAGGWVPIELGPETATAIALLARREGATPFMVLLAALQTLLYRCGGQTDFLIGTPVANRHRGELEPLIGFFVNTLPLRADLSGDPSFRQLIARARESALGAYAHQDLPFEKLVEHLAPQQRWGRSPLVQAVFALQNAPASALELPGLSIESLSAKGRTAKFDLTLSLEEGPSGLCGGFEYSTDIFDVETVESLAERFGVLLAGIVARPETRLSRLPLLSESERRQVLVEWNPAVPTAETACVHELFERHAELTPEAPALEWADTQRLSYGELNTRANRLAHRLQALGVGPGSLVGLFAERSAEAVIGMLAILKAGGAYVPLDPAYPAERLTYLLTDAQVPVLLAQEHLAPILPTSNARVLCLNTAGRLTKVEGDDLLYIPGAESNLPGLSAPADLAYVIYTSGSTGNPKGVQVERRNLANLIRWHLKTFSFAPGDRAAQIAAPAFDACAWEVWTCLCAGASLHFPDTHTRLCPTDLRDWLLDRQITHCFLPTPLAERVLTLPWPEKAPLRWLFVGGDTLHSSPPPGLPFALSNNYGPTENTVVSTSGVVPPIADGPLPSIGRPIGGTEAYILDSNGRPVPVGVAGELCLGGAGLARGYLGRAALTAEKFVPHPYSERPGARLYRSGDLARFRVDGRIEFLGRTDDQVKIRGHRVEPGEVASALSGHAGVRSCAVIACADGQGTDRRLVAYVVAKESLLESELRAWLQGCLPPYMLPSLYVFLAELPLNINGKLDRRALPVPDAARPEAGEDFLAPRNPREVQLTRIWERLLEVKPVSVRDDFFELGGHSLLAMRLLEEVREAFGQSVTLPVLFEKPTIEALALVLQEQTPVAEAQSLGNRLSRLGQRLSRFFEGDAVERQVQRAVEKLKGAFPLPLLFGQRPHSPAETDTPNRPSGSPIVAIQPAGVRRPFFCIHPVGGSVLCYIELARHLHKEQPFYGLQSPGLADGQPLLDSIEKMAAHYIKTMRRVQPAGPYLLGGWSLGGVVAYEMAQQLEQQGQQVDLLALLDSALPDGERSNRGTDDAHLVAAFAQNVADLLGTEVALPPDPAVTGLDGQLQAILDWSSANAAVEKTRSVQLHKLMQVYKTNYRALQQYVPRAYSGRITLLLSSEQAAQRQRTPIADWSGIALGGLHIEAVTGDHYSIVKNPDVQVTAERLEGFLAAAHAQAARSHRVQAMAAQ